MFNDAIPVFFQALVQLRTVDKHYLSSHHNHHISRWQAVLIFSEAFPKYSFQTVSNYRFLNFFPGNGKPDPRTGTQLITDQYGYGGVAYTVVTTENLPVFPGSCQP